MKPGPYRRLAYAAWMALWLAAAAGIVAIAWPMQIERGCWLGEWPFEDGCPDYPTSKNPEAPAQVFIDHLKRNPGDGRAYARLVGILWNTKDPRLATVLPYAQKFAPYHPTVLSVRANSALVAKDWTNAAEAFTLMVDRGQPEALKPLLELMVYPATQPAMLAQVQPGRRWLDIALANLSPQVPPIQVLPFVTDGMQAGILKPQTALALVDRMKQSGQWIDAYSLWVATLGKVPEGLFNAGFDQRSKRRGFDWEWPELPPSGNPGMRVLQASASPRKGLLMEIEMSGRAAVPQPMLSQVAVLLAPSYRFTGSYMAERLQTTDGLVWAFRCADGGERFAQTPALKDTQRKWTTFDVMLSVPASCGAAVRVTLEAASPGEARAGMAGIVTFDDLELKAVEPGAKG